MQQKNKMAVRKITVVGVMAAFSVVLAFFIHIPFPPATYLEYDPADVPIFFVTLTFGPVWGGALALIVSVLQGVTVSAQSGIYGIIMHFAATGSFVLASGLIYKAKSTWKGAITALIFGCIAQTLIMIPMNLIFTPLFNGAPVDAVKEMILPVIIPFNLMKAGINSVVTMILHGSLTKRIRRGIGED